MSARLTASPPTVTAWPEVEVSPGMRVRPEETVRTATRVWRVTAAPAEAEAPAAQEQGATARPWVTIVWNDPVNLMSYVTYVFQSYFGYSRAEAEKLMHDVHDAGRAVVSTGSLEEMERDVAAMHGFGLWATFSHDT